MRADGRGRDVRSFLLETSGDAREVEWAVGQREKWICESFASGVAQVTNLSPDSSALRDALEAIG
jgi:hypothetical protein